MISTDRWRRLGELFERAMDLPPDEQHTFLTTACPEDEVLRREVELMLQAAADTGGILDRSLGGLAAHALAGPPAGIAPGDWVGPYQVRREVARGGMGVVYEAHDPRLDRGVALKCLPPGLQAEPRVKAQFLAEARAVAALDHPNICTVYELGDAGPGGLFIAMAFYEGRTLRERLAEGRLPVGEALAIAAQVARGLECAHDAGVVHRDVKPSNVILTQRGEAKILDFGIAQLDTDRIPLGQRAGTPHYMSPEQVRGDAADQRSDLWSLGVVLYEMLAGRRPFTGGDARAVMRAILEQDVPRLEEFRPAVPKGLAATVHRLLAREPLDRFQSASELLAALSAAPATGAVSARLGPGPGRLPSVLTSFVGREAEIASVMRLLTAHRLVTLTGPGGTGKTRLVLEIARRAAPRFEHGVVFVPLAAIRDPSLVPSVMLEALDYRVDAGRSPADNLAAALQTRHALIVLDNFEQVSAGATILPSILAGCPGVHVLVTSRVALRVDGEHLVAVPPLALPRAGSTPPGEPGESPALALFADRARAVDPSFTLQGDALDAAAELCRRLDGLPLAIELAAANLKLLPPRQMLARLESRFKVLQRGGRDRPSRHRSLRAAIAWSYDLLSPVEQQAFRVLGVFAGNCSLDAAEAVCERVAAARARHGAPAAATNEVSGAAAAHPASDAPLAAPGAPGDHPSTLDDVAVVDALSALIDHSLVYRVESGAGDVRLGMLESIRVFARECLQAAGEIDRASEAHAQFYLRLAEDAEPAITGPDQKVWLDRLQAEHDNLRAAIAWCSDAGRDEAALRFGAALWRFWLARGHLAEGRQRLERLMRAAGGAPLGVRVRAQNGLATLLYSEGHVRRARDLLHETLQLCVDRDEPGAAVVLNNLAWVASEQGDLDGAAALCQEALARNRAVGDTRGVALALNNHAWVAMYRGVFREARELHLESLALRRRIGDRRGVAFTLSNLAYAEAWLGDYDRSAALLADGVAELLDVSDGLLLGWAAVVEGVCLYLEGRFDEALPPLERARRGWREGGNRTVLASALSFMGYAAAARRDAPAARAAFAECLRVYREIETDWGVATALHGLAWTARIEAAHDRAVAALDESLALRRRIGHRLGIAECLELRAELLRDAGDRREAAVCLASAAAIRVELGTPLSRWRAAVLDPLRITDPE